MQDYKVSVGICSYRSPSLPVVLFSLGGQTLREFEVVVVFDGTEADFREKQERCFQWMGFPIRSFWSPRDVRGYPNIPKCQNKGVGEASSDCVMLLNDDTIPRFDAFEKLFRGVCEGQAVSGVFVCGDFPNFHEFPNPRSDAGEFGGFCAISKENWILVGGDDEEMAGHGASSEYLNYRIILAGIHRVIRKDILGFHIPHSYDYAEGGRHDVKQQTETYRLLLEKTGFVSVEDFWKFCRKHVEWVGFDENTV